MVRPLETSEKSEKSVYRLINRARKEAQNKLESARNIDGLTLLHNVKQPFEQQNAAQFGLVLLPLINRDIEGGDPHLRDQIPFTGVRSWQIKAERNDAK